MFNLISLIIPCFNEEKNLDKLLENLHNLLQKYSSTKIEILIVDNGSTDNSKKIILNHNLYLLKKIKLIQIRDNIGYGNGVYKGILSSKGDIIAWCHADLQINPQDVIEIYLNSREKLKKEKFIVKGKRVNRSIFDLIFTFGMSVLTYIFFKIKLSDINAQPKIFKKNFINHLKNPPKDFSFDLFFLLKASQNDYQILEFPVVWGERYAGEAKGGGSIKLKLKLTLRTIKFMYKLKKSLNGINIT